MQRVSQKSVTVRYRHPEKEVPILVLAREEGHIDAWVTFLVAGERVGVRVFRRGDFNEVLYRSLSKKAQRRVRQLIALRQGIAEEEPSFWLRQFLRENKFLQKAAAAWDDDFKKFGQLSRQTEKMLRQAWRVGSPLTRLSVLVTKRLSGARLVLWFTEPPGDEGKREPPWPQLEEGSRDEIERELESRVAYFTHFRRGAYVPAILCPQLETAFYVDLLFEITGRGLGICLWCGEVFQKTRTDRLYCCQSHADAYRIQQWRANKKKGTGRTR